MANPLIMLKISAIPDKVKRNVLSKEIVTIRPELPWDVTVKHLNNLSKRMAFSGYSERERLQTIQSGVNGCDEMLKTGSTIFHLLGVTVP